MKTNLRFLSKRLIAITFFLSLNLIITAQTDLIIEEDKNSSLDIGLDLQSRYIWRGIELGGNSASAQPYIEYSIGKFAFGAWGAYSLGGDNYGQEADLYITYSILDNLSLTITDYFFPVDLAFNDYFDYKNNTTGHVFEIMVSYSFTKKNPIGFTIATNFYGADQDEDGDQSYSTYIEANYDTSISSIDLSFFVGAVFGDKGAYNLTDGSGFINLGLRADKSIKITDSFSLPVNAALIFNPDAENIFITFGLSI